MAQRRRYGTGTVWQDERGRWRGQIRLDGRRYTVSGRTRAEVADKLKDKRDAYERGEDVSTPKDDGMPNLGAWLRQWADDNAPGAAPGTIDLRNRAIKHLAPLADIPLDALTVTDIEALLARKAGRLGQRSLAIVRTVLTQALHEAERHRVITWNPAGSDAKGKPRVHLPKSARPSRARRALSLAQAQTLLEVAHGDRAEILVVLGLYLGLRPGEVTGLRWSDVDTEARTVTIAQMRRRSPDGSLSMCDPKAESGRTIHDVPDAVLDALARHKARAAKQHGRIGGLVVATRTGAPLDPSNHRREVARLAKAAGIFWQPALTPNELRHSAASLWAANGAPLPQIAHALGHKDLRMASTVYAVHRTAPTSAPVAL